LGATVQWIEGRCLSYGESLPYWPFRDLVRSWLGVLAERAPDNRDDAPIDLGEGCVCRGRERVERACEQVVRTMRVVG
jgi:hypothetical protein